MNFGLGDAGGSYMWSNEWQQVPGDFMGHATSFGSQAALSVESPLTHFGHGSFHDLTQSNLMMPPPRRMPPPAPPQGHALQATLSMEQPPSADVFAAAALLQNGPLPRTPAGNPHEHLLMPDLTPGLGPPAVGSMRHQPLSDFRRESRVDSNGEHDNTFRDMMFGSSGRHATPRGPHPGDVQWGSDSNFNTPQYLPPSDRETTEALEKQQLSYMQCLEVNDRATTTSPSSPTADVPASPLRSRARRSLSQVGGSDDADDPPRKRRKSKVKVEADAHEPGLRTTGARHRKRRSRTDGADFSPPAETAGKRRRSGTSGALKQPRENLTDEQKRENHIKSEQKRRTLIKEGFDDLCIIVPGLKGGGFSKSAVLSQAAEFLEELLQGNAPLRQQLARLGG